MKQAILVIFALLSPSMTLAQFPSGAHFCRDFVGSVLWGQHFDLTNASYIDAENISATMIDSSISSNGVRQELFQFKTKVGFDLDKPDGDYTTYLSKVRVIFEGGRQISCKIESIGL